MKYIIQTAHANHISYEDWTNADEADSEESAHDILRSPSFDVYDGLVIRIVSTSDWLLRYSGIYRGDECVCVDFGSAVSLKHPWNLTEESFDVSKGYPWWMIWNICKQPSWMIHAVKNAISRRRLVNALADCISSTMPLSRMNYLLEKTILRAIDVIENENSSDADLRSVYVDLNSQINGASMFMLAESAAYLTYSIMTKMTDKSMSQDMIYACAGSMVEYIRYIKGYTVATASEKVCDKIRNALPFYEVAMAITAPDRSSTQSR